MIRVYTKIRHVESIRKVLTSFNLEHEIFTTKNPPSPEHEFEPFDLGVSYSYPRKITKKLLKLWLSVKIKAKLAYILHTVLR